MKPSKAKRAVALMSGCMTKNRYYTERIANEVALHQSKKSGIALKVYQCKFCNGWHLTSKVGK